jgi:hypothetical protein
MITFVVISHPYDNSGNSATASVSVILTELQLLKYVFSRSEGQIQ